MADAPVVHVVDDDPSFRRAVSRLLRSAGFAVAQYESAAQFLQQRTAGGAGCVLADLRMPGMGGLELQASLARAPDPLPVVFLSAFGDVPSTVRAMKQGAEDFLTKNAPRQELIAAVHHALERDARERSARRHQREVMDRIAQLTPREREVLCLVVQGRLNKEIAGELGINERTVKFHRTAITSKLDTYSVAELTRLAQEAGLLP